VKTDKSSKIDAAKGTKPMMMPVPTAPSVSVLSEEDKEKIQNAPRRISKIESTLEKHEVMMNDIDKEMIEVWYNIQYFPIL